MAFQHLVAGTVSSAEVILVKDNLTLSSLALSQHLLSSWAQSSAIPYAIFDHCLPDYSQYFPGMPATLLQGAN